MQAVHVKAYLLALAARGIFPATRSSALFALRSFYEYLRAEDLVALNPTRGNKVPGARKARTEIYTDTEAEQILAWAVDQPGVRGQVGHAVLPTLRYTGLRRNEIAMLRLDQVDLDARRISLVGKGDKARIVPIAPPLVPVFDDYLTSLRPVLAKSAFFFVNPSAHHGERYKGRYGPMTVAKLIQRAGTGAGVTGRHFPTAGATPTPPACCAGGPTSMSSSASSATPTSPRRPGTCTSRTPTSPTRWTRPSLPSRATPPAASRGRRRGADRRPPGRSGPHR